MSYNLGLTAREGHPVPTVEALDAYFRARRHTRVEEVGSAIYLSEHTGVQFRVEYGTHRDEEGWDPIRIRAITESPHTRALELLEEVEAIASTFDLLVNDPTIDGMGMGGFDREGLLRGCLFASRFGFVVELAMNRLSDDTVRIYDDERLTEHWRWNRAQPEIELATPNAVFVPHVTYVAAGKQTLSTVAWTGTMPFLLPDVDAITTMDLSTGTTRLKVVPTSALGDVLRSFPVREKPLPHRVVQATPELGAAVASAASIVPEPTVVPASSVLGIAFWNQIKDDHFKRSGGQKVEVRAMKKPPSKKPANKKPANKKPANTARKLSPAKPRKRSKPAAKKSAPRPTRRRKS